MKQIKEKEEVNAQRETQSRDVERVESSLTHMSMLARFHNTAAIDTIHTLSLLTSRCSKLFCHRIMIDRIAAMLNYFLLKLVLT